MNKVDVIIGLQYGDEAKAKCAYSILKQNKDYYNYVVRFNGGPNAGHTIYHEGRKFVTHQIPVGVFFDKKSIIGPCSVVDYDKLNKEADELSKFLDKDISNLILIDKRAHIITKKHIEMDSDGSLIGSTKSGIAYAYGDKHLRTGIRYDDWPLLKTDFERIDIYDYLYNKNDNFLFEGAQGWGLDIDFGDYPYVTSSHCGIAGVVASGVNHKMIGNVFGIAKIYETYVGNKEFQPKENTELYKFQEVGQEIGATTGRVRQCNYLNLDKLIPVIKINGVTDIIFNKVDVLEKVNIFKLIYKKEIVMFDNFLEMKYFINNKLIDEIPHFISITYSGNPNEI
jgi:adenylosuccinate synthase